MSLFKFDKIVDKIKNIIGGKSYENRGTCSRYFSKSGALTEDDLIKLQNKKYCKNTFDLNYSSSKESKA